MTALKQYQHLESGGLWRAEPDAQRRDVVVSFGDATLVISDKAGRALSHWSLPAISRLNPEKSPALFTPDPNGIETLEIDDDDMIAAIEKVRHTLARMRPKPGRLRWLGLGASFATVAALALFWMPNAVIRQTLSALPLSKRTEIGATLLGHVQSLTGTSCRSRLGSQALNVLKTRTLGPDAPGQIVVLPSGPNVSLYLPGGIITLNRAVVEDHEDPAIAAGYVLAAAARILVEDPIEPILHQAGLKPTLQLLTTGDLPDGILRSYAEVILANPQSPVDQDAMLSVFAGANVPSTPYAYAIDLTGETTIGLIEADPLAGQQSPLVLRDEDWVSLQNICDS